MSTTTAPLSIKDIHQRFPAVVCLVLLVAGIFVGWQFNFPSPFLAGIGGIFCCIFLVVFAIRRFRVFALIPVFFIVFCFGIFKITIDVKSRPADAVENQTNDTVTVALTGIVTGRPVLREGMAAFEVQSESMDSPSINLKVDGGVAVLGFSDSLTSGKWADLREGDRIRMSGQLQALQAPRNPGEFDYGRYMRLRGVYARFTVQSDSDFVVEDHLTVSRVSRILIDVRQYLNSTIDSAATGEEANLLRGLILGERTDLSPGVKQAFMNSGLMHILAVSGFNVGLVAMILAALFSSFRLKGFGGFVAMGAGLVLFGLITGAQPSVMRAVVMALVFLGGRLLERRSDMYNTLAFAACLLLVFDARTLFDAGFQLSFAAVGGLAFFYPRLEELSQRVPARIRQSFAWKYLVASVAVSLAATFGTLPLTMFYFHKISFVGIGMNIIAVPLSSVILALGFAAMAGGLISFSLAQIFSLPAVFLSHALLEFTVIGSRIRWAFIELHPGPGVCALVGAMLVYWGRGEARALIGRGLICLLIAGNLVLANSLYSEWHPELEVAFLDVGQGDAAVIRTPSGETLLIDCGPESIFLDTGERVVLPYLNSLGVDSVDLMVISHPHRDHIGGATSILHTIPVHVEVDAGIPSDANLVSSFYRDIDSIHVVRCKDSAGCIIDVESGLRLYVLHPSGRFRPSKGTVEGGINNQSLVLKLVFGNTSILFSGDAQAEAEHRLLALYGDFLACDILKVGHHGSSNATSDRILSAIHPRDAVISVGQGNQFGHPAPGTIVKLANLGVHIHRTDIGKAAVFCSDGKKWTAVDWK